MPIMKPLGAKITKVAAGHRHCGMCRPGIKGGRAKVKRSVLEELLSELERLEFDAWEQGAYRPCSLFPNCEVCGPDPRRADLRVAPAPLTVRLLELARLR